MTGHIFIYGEIGRGLGQSSINTVRAQIDPNASDYILHIASPGGDVFEGFGIYNVLKNTGKKIETHIESVTASIATLVAFAGERIIMNKTAQFMIHNPFISDLKGDSRDLRNVAGQLDQIKALLMDVTAKRAARNGKPISPDDLSQLYDNETWINSDDAKEKYGFVDDVQDAIKAVARIDLNQVKKMEKETFLKSVIKNLFGSKKFKNEFKETLQDGTVVVVMSEDGDWTGKQVVTEAGEPLPPGDYQLASGKVISVGENSTIAEVKDTPTAENNEDMSKIKELEEKLAASEQARAAAEGKVAEAAQTAVQQQATAKFENSIKELQKKIQEQEEALAKTVGQMPPLGAGPVFKNSKGENASYDPMGEDALEFFRSRNLVN